MEKKHGEMALGNITLCHMSWALVMLKPAEEESCSLLLQAARVHEELLVFHADFELIFWSVLTRQVASNIVLWPTSTRCSGCPGTLPFLGEQRHGTLSSRARLRSSVRNRKLVVADHWLCLCIVPIPVSSAALWIDWVLGLSAPSEHIKPLRRRS